MTIHHLMCSTTLSIAMSLKVLTVLDQMKALPLPMHSRRRDSYTCEKDSSGPGFDVGILIFILCSNEGEQDVVDQAWSVSPKQVLTLTVTALEDFDEVL